MKKTMLPKRTMAAFLCLTTALAGFGYLAYSADYDHAGETAPNVAGVSSGQDPLRVESNGYVLADYANFYKDWEQVTVRYREDTGELRFTYANDLALKGLREGKGVYQDGSVFLKAGFMTMPDPGFASSISPFGARRYQLMVKDSKRHPETDGWGYALFSAHGTGGVPSGEATDPQTCHACHKLVPERGFVFSIPMAMNPREAVSDLKLIGAGETAPQVKFYTESKKKLPEAVQALVAGDWVRVLQGELTQNAFDGTLEEIPPFLIGEALARKLPTAFIVNSNPEKTSGSSYVLFQADPDTQQCETKSGKAGAPLIKYVFSGESKKTAISRFCADAGPHAK